MAEEKVLLTTEGLEKLKSELEHLREVHRPEVLERLQRAKELSDTVDNAEYDEAKNEQAFVEGRIMTLERMIKHAEVIPVEKSRPAYVRFGSRVKVRDSDGGERTYVIVGGTESNPTEGKISNESPVGKALLGKHVGEEVEIQAPKGLIRLKISAISWE
ncbi:MAG: transcription elongation factor GreA [Dehalococcoidia bacterium]|nr:Transcription elongation factor GreA [Chloroflexota bacterium]MBT9159480.1 Transcription elongation factor GreA [Chloroflexota bacterium]MBT9161968.1 Transcription elongation factor GreA [Chloroflexota bacterium]